MPKCLCLSGICFIDEERVITQFILSLDDDEDSSYPMGMPMIEKKGVVEGVSQRSHQKPIQNPQSTLVFSPNVVNIQLHNFKKRCDPSNGCVDHESDSKNQISKFSSMNTNQATKQTVVSDYFDIQNSIFLGSFSHMAMTRGLMEQFEYEFPWIEYQFPFVWNFLDPIIQKQVVNLHVVPKCKTSRALYNPMFSNFNFDQFDCCVFYISHYCKMDQTEFFLTKQCETNFNSQVFGADLN